MNWGLLILYSLFGLVVIFVLVVMGNKFKAKRLRKRYKEEEDLSKHGEQRRSTETRQSGARKLDVQRNSSFGERGSLQTTTVTTTQPNISRNKNTNKVDTLFRNIRRRK